MASSKVPPLAGLTLGALAAGTVALHLLTARGYGYFRDELYYLACGQHPAWGYVDHPPLVGWVAAAVRSTLGTSLLAIRLLPAIAIAAAAWCAGAMSRDLGGGRFAQALAALCVALAPVYLALGSVFSMNAFDVLFWAVALWILIRLLRGADPRFWVGFGVVAGVGLLNKISLLFLGFGVLVGLVVGGRRDVLRSRWPWIGGAVAALIFAPYVAWEVAHGWPTLEFMDHARRFKNVALAPGDFLFEQLLQAGPLALPVWLSGLVWLLFGRDARGLRPIGITYLVVLSVLISTASKPYYLGAAYTVLFAAGATALETWTARRATIPVRAALLAVVCAGGILLAPLAKPLLSEDTYVRYAAALGITSSPEEHHELGRLPQFYADMHGWPELAVAVAEVYRTLPPEDQRRACIFGQNYGQAGAIDLFGPELGLPPALSAHNSYYLWGPRDCSGEVMIVLADNRQRLEQLFEQVELGAVFECTDCMPYENDKPIWIARRLRMPMRELWSQIKSFN